MAANTETKPTNMGSESAIRLLPSTSTIAMLLSLSVKAGTHFTVTRRVHGKLSRPLASQELAQQPMPKIVAYAIAGSVI